MRLLITPSQLDAGEHPTDGQMLDYDNMDVFYAPQHAFTRQPVRIPTNAARLMTDAVTVELPPLYPSSA